MRFLFSIFIFSGFLVCHDAWDQVAPAVFRSIFPYANHSDIWKLTFNVNHKSSALLGIFEMLDWVPLYWKSNNAVLDKKNKYSNKTYAQNVASDFLQHRGAVRHFLRFMFRTFIDTKYFTESQAIRMRKIYWKADKDSKSNFTIARPLFKNKTITEFSKTHKDFGTKFENITGTFYYMHYSMASRLNWTLPH